MDGATVELDSLGAFTLHRVDPSWSSLLLLGARDFYEREEPPALQLVPDAAHWTIDIPDLSRPRTAESEPPWRWLTEEWPFAVSSRSVAVTNLRALRGERVTEAARWEDDQWEMFTGAGPDVPEHDVRRVPTGTMLAPDPTLVALTELQVGKGLWRNPSHLEWQPWGP